MNAQTPIGPFVPPGLPRRRRGHRQGACEGLAGGLCRPAAAACAGPAVGAGAPAHVDGPAAGTGDQPLDLRRDRSRRRHRRLRRRRARQAGHVRLPPSRCRCSMSCNRISAARSGAQADACVAAAPWRRTALAPSRCGAWRATSRRARSTRRSAAGLASALVEQDRDGRPCAAPAIAGADAAALADGAGSSRP